MLRNPIGLLGLLLLFSSCADAGETAVVETPDAAPESFAGRWNVTVEGPTGSYPSWFEIAPDGERWTGRFLGRVGHARPIERVSVEGRRLEIRLPIQYERHPEDLRFSGTLENGRIRGTTYAPDGTELPWTAERAPDLPAAESPRWGEPIELFNGRDLTGWRVRNPDATNHWRAENGVLANTAAGTDLMTERGFMDFRLTAEYRYPEGSNSGIYLRGRYEVQIHDDYGHPAGPRSSGSIYGFLAPSTNAARPAGEWQTCEITLLGRYITVVLNGVTVLDHEEIPGPTGGALDSDEGSPGPILFQGDHGPIEFRNLVLTPVVE